MKLLLVLFTLVILASALTDQEQWMNFKAKHGKTYKNLREETQRFGIFQSNLRKMESHNARYESGKETFEMGVNQFSDLTTNEFLHLWKAPVPNFNATFMQKLSGNYKLSSGSFDWRLKDAVLPVLNQGGCGSCWAFSAAGALEGQNYIKHKVKIVLSPQELVDCSQAYGPKGCDGGWQYDAFRYVKDNGISALKDYPYNAKDGNCRKSSTARVSLKITGYTALQKTEAALQKAIETIGPVSISIYHGYIQGYESGIFNHKNCPIDQPTHSVLVVGYGVENGVDYWIMKNSWGTEWGEKGYFRIVKNGNNTCGIVSYAFVPNAV